jgi:HD-GYP domain-containing protein (c-di-GMP phosphodiesterase class II)
MWQTNGQEKTIFYFKIIELDLKHKVIIILYNGEKDLVDPNRPVFMKLHFRETLFKGKVIKFETNKLTISIPSEIHLREYRNSLRVNFGPGQESVELRVLTPGIDPTRIPMMKAYLKDVSSKGLGLLISKNNSHLFKKNQILEIFGFSNLPLSRNLIGRVVYCVKYAVEDRRILFKVGVELSTIIPKDKFEKLIKDKKNTFQTNSNHLLQSNVFTPELRTHIESEISKTLDKMKKRPAIGSYVKSIEDNSFNDFYLSEHVKILVVVCTYIAQVMKWPSWASIEKFVFAAYLHDAPFIEHPRLARIKNLHEYGILKDQLTDLEKEIYLSSPSLSVDIVKKDPDHLEQVIEMLKYQKELPSGEGFLRELNDNEISVLGAFFIIAHDLTDEIISNFDWSIERWLLRVKKEYSKGHFKDIISSIISSKERIIAHALTSGAI